MKRIGIKEIAKRAGVSIGTVDRVLHKRGNVKESTREKILQLIEELGYTPNLIAKTLSSKKEYRLVALIPDPEELPYWNSPKAGIEKAAHELKSYNVRVEIRTYSIKQPKNFTQRFEEVFQSKMDGLIVSPAVEQEAELCLQHCRSANIPYMFIDGNLDDDHCLGYFGQNAEKSGMVAARLMQLKVDSDATIAVVNISDGHRQNPHVLAREKGFRTFFDQLDIPYKIVSLDIVQQSLEETESKLQEFFSKHAHIGGMFVLNSRVHRLAVFLEKHHYHHVFLIGYDLLEENRELMKSGVVDVLISQKAFEQGYNSTMSMFQHLTLEREIKRMNYSPIDIVLRENLDDYKIKG